MPFCNWLFEDQFLILSTFSLILSFPQPLTQKEKHVWDMLRCWRQAELPRKTQTSLNLFLITSCLMAFTLAVPSA